MIEVENKKVPHSFRNKYLRNSGSVSISTTTPTLINGGGANLDVLKMDDGRTSSDNNVFSSLRSLFEIKSRIIYTLVKGDTVYQHRYKYLYRYLTTNRTDTILKSDSIRVPYPVEKQLTRWQILRMELGGWAFGIIILFILIIIGRIVFKLKK